MGATLRVYIENLETDASRPQQDPQDALADLIEIAEQIADIKGRAAREAPDVVT